MTDEPDESRVGSTDDSTPTAGATEDPPAPDEAIDGDEPDRSLVALATGIRARALLVLAVLVALVASGDLSTAMLAAALVLGALAAVVLLAPGVLDNWRFHVLIGAGVTLYGVVYALDQPSLAGRAVAGVIVLLGLLVVANHLGIVPWSDNPRRI